ncbi:unnamed protein product [Protopolystoma xenopodis]|uniref:Uncharacterized protein n=1 Tax=Protopolystoma xenopodis TaxID=117903 RepID=A0A3S5B2A6_9PLAT|nr:unnamed protein product [Protopolystoma xenopodis]
MHAAATTAPGYGRWMGKKNKLCRPFPTRLIIPQICHCLSHTHTHRDNLVSEEAAERVCLGDRKRPIMSHVVSRPTTKPGTRSEDGSRAYTLIGTTLPVNRSQLSHLDRPVKPHLDGMVTSLRGPQCRLPW